MPDVRNFIIPEANYEGLYKLSDNLGRQQRAKQAEEQRLANLRGVTTKTLMDFADPKEALSGTPTDPETIKRFAEIQKLGLDFINQNKGVDQNQLLMYLSPKVNELREYTERAKVIKGKINKRLEGITDNSGYDRTKLSEQALKKAWYNSDGSVKSLNEINPDIDYVSLAVEENPYEVTNNKGLDEWLKGQRLFDASDKITEWTSRGGKTMRKVKTTAYNFAVPELDEKGVHTRNFVPKYDLAIDGDEQITFEGKQIPLLDEKVFNTIMGNSQGTADWVRGQVMDYINKTDIRDADGNRISINSPQAKNVGRYILYEELKGRGMGSMQNEAENKPNQIKFFAPRSGGSGGGGSNSEAVINNIYQRIRDIMDKVPKGSWQQINTLDNDMQGVLFKALENAGHTDLTERDVQLENIDGKIYITYSKQYAKEDPTVRARDPITSLSFIGTNMAGRQPNAAAKVETVRRGSKNELTSKNKGEYDDL